MLVHRLNLVSKIIIKTKSPKIFLAIFITILSVLSLSIGAYLFTGNLINSYKNTLQNSYLGFQPRFILKSENEKFLYEVEKLLTKDGYKTSVRKTYKDSFELNIKNKKIKKQISFFIYKDRYLDDRFGSSGGIYINEIMQKILKDEKSIKIHIKEDEKLVLGDFKSVKTGFLTDEAIVFIDGSKIKKLVDIKKLHFLLEIDDEVDKNIKDSISKLGSKHEVLNINWEDRLKSEKEAYENFKLFEWAKVVFLFILMGNIIVIILVVQNILLELKEKSFNIILKMGMGFKEVLGIFSIASILIFGISTVLGFLFLNILKSYYLQISNFKEDFFLTLSLSDYTSLIYAMGILLLFTIVLNTIILKEGHK